MTEIKNQQRRFALAAALSLLLGACSTGKPVSRVIDTDINKKTELGAKSIRVSVDDYKKDINRRQFVLKGEVSQDKKIYSQEIRAYSDGGTRRGNWELISTEKGRWVVASGEEIKVSSLSSAFLVAPSGARAFDHSGHLTVTVESSDPFISFSSSQNDNALAEALTRDGYDVPIRTVDAIKLTFAGGDLTLPIKIKDLRSAIKAKAIDIFNKEIKSVRINIVNVDSMVAINDAEITIDGSPPGPRSVLGKYFNDPRALAYAENMFPAYLTSKEMVLSSAAGNKIALYPGSYSVSVKHPKFFFKEQRIDIGRTNAEVFVKLSELGQKTRIKIVD